MLQEVQWFEEMSMRRKQPISASASFRVSFGDAEQVSDGFALALSAMEANAEVLMMGPDSIPEED
jgi:hypothetical protein